MKYCHFVARPGLERNMTDAVNRRIQIFTYQSMVEHVHTVSTMIITVIKLNSAYVARPDVSQVGAAAV